MTHTTTADKDNSGLIAREELATELNSRTAGAPELKRFLDKITASKGLDMGNSGDDDTGGSEMMI